MKYIIKALEFLAIGISYLGCILLSGYFVSIVIGWLVDADKYNDPNHAFAVLIIMGCSFFISMIVTCAITKSFWRWVNGD